MVGAICGDVTHDNGNPVANVTVKVIDSEKAEEILLKKPVTQNISEGGLCFMVDE